MRAIRPRFSSGGCAFSVESGTEPNIRLYRSLAYIGTRLRELEMIPYMVQTYA